MAEKHERLSAERLAEIAARASSWPDVEDLLGHIAACEGDVERMRPVVEAACEWVNRIKAKEKAIETGEPDCDGHRATHAEWVMREAVDAYEGGQGR